MSSLAVVHFIETVYPKESPVSTSWVIAGGSHTWLLCGFKDPNISPQTYTANALSFEQLHNLRARFSSHQVNGLRRSSLTHLVVWLHTPDLKQVTMTLSRVCHSHSLEMHHQVTLSLDMRHGVTNPQGWHCCQATLTHRISEDMWPIVKILNWQICS